jgi:DNA-binding response OmpR family regulator
VIDCEKRFAQRAETAVSLTPSEAVILAILLDKYGQLVSHSDIVQKLQGYELPNKEAAKIIRPLISRLREKLLVVGIEYEDLKNVRGAGYLLECESN